MRKFSDLYIRIYALPYHQLFGVCLCGVLLQATVFSREGGLEAEWFAIPFHSYREILAGGNPELLRFNLMNVILFFPAGLLTGDLLPEKCTLGQQLIVILCLFGLFSADIEWAQYLWALGRTEMDDILHNTLGVAIGLAAFHLNSDDTKPVKDR